MDRIRACYETEVRFFTDSDTTIPIRWYFCQPGAKRYPGYTRFSSGNFASLPWLWFGPGEVQETPRPFRNGKPPPFDGTTAPGYDGQFFKGPAEVFANGVSLADSVPLNTEPNGLCPECHDVPPFDFCLLTNTSYTLPQTLWLHWSACDFPGMPNPVELTYQGLCCWASACISDGAGQYTRWFFSRDLNTEKYGLRTAICDVDFDIVDATYPPFLAVFGGGGFPIISQSAGCVDPEIGVFYDMFPTFVSES